MNSRSDQREVGVHRDVKAVSMISMVTNIWKSMIRRRCRSTMVLWLHLDNTLYIANYLCWMYMWLSTNCLYIFKALINQAHYVIIDEKFNLSIYRSDIFSDVTMIIGDFDGRILARIALPHRLRVSSTLISMISFLSVATNYSLQYVNQDHLTL